MLSSFHNENRRPGSPPKHQSGVALIIALLVVALATVTAVAIAWHEQIDIRRSENILRADQAYLQGLGVESWAIGMLERDIQSTPPGNKVDGLADNWAEPLPATPIEGGHIAGHIEDLQGRFNVNNLYVPLRPDIAQQQRAAVELAYFQRLLDVLNLDPAIAPAVADWIDGDTQARFPNGAEDYAYLDRQPPYRTANTRIASVSELRLVKGMTNKAYDKLAPYVTALPENTAINVNTAPAPVLQALSDKIDSNQLKALVQTRVKHPLTSTSAFMQQLGLAASADHASPATKAAAEQLKSLIGVSSQYYRVEADVKLDETQLRLFSLLAEQANGKVQVLARTMGTY